MPSRKQYTIDEVKKAKEIIIDELSEGRSLLSILRKHKDIPRRQIIYQWLNSSNERYDAEFANNYARAREDSSDINAEQIEQIVDDVRNGKLQPDQARVMGDLLKWTAGRKKPKKYGNKLDVTTDGEKITQIQRVIVEPRDNTDTNA
jgi:polyhydroxyalkanoate synthesis regulator phasin